MAAFLHFLWFPPWWRPCCSVLRVESLRVREEWLCVVPVGVWGPGLVESHVRLATCHQQHSAFVFDLVFDGGVGV